MSSAATERTPLVVSAPKESYDGSSATKDCMSPTTPHQSTTMDPEKRRAVTAIRIATVFCLVFMVVELVGGYMAHSLAILTDAAHLLTDVGAFMLSLVTLHASVLPSTHQYSYGYHRAEVLGTLASVVTIWMLVGAIVVESFQRINSTLACATYKGKRVPKGLECNAVETKIMIVVGVLGLAVNLGCAAILSWGGSHGHSHGLDDGGHGHSHGEADDGDHGHSEAEGDQHQSQSGGGSMALNSAFLHALGDSVQSVGVILAGVFTYVMNNRTYGHPTEARSLYNLADPACSLLFAAVTLYTTKSLIRQLFNILMESTPDFVDYAALRGDLVALDGVEALHDLHVWSLTAGKAALSVHLVADDHSGVLERAQRVCTKHGVDHTTIQIDPSSVGSDRCATNLGCHQCE